MTKQQRKIVPFVRPEFASQTPSGYKPLLSHRGMVALDTASSFQQRQILAVVWFSGRMAGIPIGTIQRGRKFWCQASTCPPERLKITKNPRVLAEFGPEPGARRTRCRMYEDERSNLL